jgi:N-acetylmuramoyl-L-alanine amidase
MGLILLLAACGSPTPTPSGPLPSGGSATPSASSTAGPGQVVPAPGGSSTVYRPNPRAIVVAIDPGHGGCLDWGVANPYDNKVGKSEKADTLGIALVLRDLLTAQGITVVLTRTDDSALAGDDYPSLGCNGPPWRDVNGDGLAGFGPSVPEATRTRDELSARIDLANVARADVAISIHINSMTQGGQVYKIAATQTFFTNAFPWADASAQLAGDVQDGVVAAMAGAASYDRQDRGTDGTAPYLYFLKPAGTAENEPSRGLLMPGILSEVGSVSLEAESELLSTPAGYHAAATGIFDGLAHYFATRPLAARIDALVPGGEAGAQPTPVAGDGPPFWPAVAPTDGQLPLRLTNTGSEPWPSGMRLEGGWGATSMPYLAAPPASLAPLDATVPALQPGESVELGVALPAAPAGGRQVAWITLTGPDGTALTERGSPPLQLGNADSKGQGS